MAQVTVAATAGVNGRCAVSTRYLLGGSMAGAIQAARRG